MPDSRRILNPVAGRFRPDSTTPLQPQERTSTHPIISSDAPDRPSSIPHATHPGSDQGTGPSIVAETLQVVLAPWVANRSTQSVSRKVQVAAKITLWGLSKAAEGLPIPGAKAIFDAVRQAVEVIEATEGNQEAFRILEGRCQELLDTILVPLKGKDISEIPLALRASLDTLQSDITGLVSKVSRRSQRSVINRMFNHEENTAIIKGIDEQIQHFLNLHSVKVGIQAVLLIDQVRHRQVLMQLKQELHQAKAGFDNFSDQNRSSCFPGTRENLLTLIKQWADSPNMDKPIYVLYGIAGVGKTTVAQTVSEYAASKSLLGASFFFSGAEEDRKNGDYFFSTLASQLAQYDAHLAEEIAAALLAVPGAPLKNWALQIKHLIVEPIQKAKLSMSPILLVIDAFDECLPAHAKIILELLAINIRSMPNFKVFLTTRPESQLEQVLKHKGNLQPFHLHEIERSIVKSDIELYLRHALSSDQVKQVLHSTTWKASDKELKFLTDQCGVLFIMASTAVKYILNIQLNKPATQMARLLEGLDIKHGGKGVMSSLDEMYLRILRSSLPEIEEDEFVLNFQTVVGAIVVLEDTLSMSSLSNLLGMKISDVQTTLQNLHSILAPTSSNQAPQLYHKSFPDFLTDKDRCIDTNFYIVPEMHHTELAEFCFRVMDTLHPNMPNLQGFQMYMSNKEMGEHRTMNITSELKYACTYWATHLSKARSSNLQNLTDLLHSFAFTHLLHWIEVLSLIGKLEVACPAMQLAQKAVRSSKLGEISDLNEMLDDGCRCVTKFYEIIRNSAGHIYYSALPFTPSGSILYRIYKVSVRGSVTMMMGQEKQWNLLMAILEGHAGLVKSIAFSPDGSRLASGSDDNTVRLWDGLTGGHIITLKGHSGKVCSVAFSSDGLRLVSGSDDWTIRLWDGLTGGHIATLEGHSGTVWSVAFPSDGSRLASGSDDKTLRLWDGLTGDHIATLEGHSHAINTVAFSSDGSRLASGSSDGTVRLWDGLTGGHILTLEGHTNVINAVAFSFKGCRLASGSDDNTIRLWDGLTGHHITTLEGHSGKVCSIAFSSDGSRLASGSDDSTVRLWDGLTGGLIATLGGHLWVINSVSFSSDGSRLASGSSNGIIRLWDGLTGHHIATLKGHTNGINAIAFSSDGSRLASGSYDHTVRLWDGLTRGQIATFDGHSGKICSIAFSSDGSKIASGSDDKTLRLWDGLTGGHIATLEGHSSIACSAAFSFDGSRLASGSYDRTVRLWDGLTGGHIATLKGHSSIACSVTFSSDGSRLASGSDDKTVRLWDGCTGNYIATLEGHSKRVSSVVFSSDGYRLVSGSYDKTVRLWDGLTGDHIATLKGHLHEVNTVAISLDGSRVASGSYDKTIRLWDGLTGGHIATFEGHSNQIKSVVFTLDGTKLISQDKRGTKQIWDTVSGQKLIKHTTIPHHPTSDLYFIKNPALWPVVGGCPVLWLPPDFPIISIQVSQGNFIFVGCRDGRAFLFNLSQLPGLQV